MIIKDGKVVGQRFYNGRSVASVYIKTVNGIKLIWESVLRKLWNLSNLNNKTYLKN